MSQFKRGLKNDGTLMSDNNAKLYNLLKNDIKKGVVFSAPRNGYLNFYYKGGRLFEFRKGEFKTHIKYASVITKNKHNALTNDQYYVTSADLANITFLGDFAQDYKRIKENCALYAGDESAGVAQVYSRYSYANDLNCSDVVVLDIEIAFDTGTDRIDLLLYDKKKRMLRFYEAKHYSNKELWSKEGTKPKVIGQLTRYNNIIKNKEGEILKAYENYMLCVNSLFDLALPTPLNIDPDTVLLVFGFDQNQLQGKLKGNLIKDGSLKDIRYYAVGNIGAANIESIWHKTKKG